MGTNDFYIMNKLKESEVTLEQLTTYYNKIQYLGNVPESEQQQNQQQQQQKPLLMGEAKPIFFISKHQTRYSDNKLNNQNNDQSINLQKIEEQKIEVENLTRPDQIQLQEKVELLQKSYIQDKKIELQNQNQLNIQKMQYTPIRTDSCHFQMQSSQALQPLQYLQNQQQYNYGQWVSDNLQNENRFNRSKSMVQLNSYINTQQTMQYKILYNNSTQKNLDYPPQAQQFLQTFNQQNQYKNYDAVLSHQNKKLNDLIYQLSQINQSQYQKQKDTEASASDEDIETTLSNKVIRSFFKKNVTTYKKISSKSTQSLIQSDNTLKRRNSINSSLCSELISVNAQNYQMDNQQSNNIEMSLGISGSVSDFSSPKSNTSIKIHLNQKKKQQEKSTFARLYHKSLQNNQKDEESEDYDDEEKESCNMICQQERQENSGDEDMQDEYTLKSYAHYYKYS